MNFSGLVMVEMFRSFKNPLMIVLMAICLLSTGSGFADQRVRIPYDVVTASGWNTGFAVTNLTDTTITNLYLDICTQEGEYGGEAGNYRENIGPLEGYNMNAGLIGNLFSATLPDSVMWAEVWHSGTAEFAVVVFVSNSLAGFGFNTFFSESANHSFPDRDEGASPRVGFEIFEFQSISSIRVWINTDMTLEEFGAIPLPSVDEIQFPQGWFKNQPRGGDGGPDAGRFLRSPGAAVDGEFIVEEHFGHSWTHNATVIQMNIPIDEQGLLTGSTVAKFHEVTFNAGRIITVLFSPEDVPYVRISRDVNRISDEPTIPDSWRLVEYTTQEQLVIMLPEETLVIRADNEDSFQGPVPELAVAF